MLWQVIAMVSSMLFTNFLQSVLFLKALLSVIEGGYDFAYYAKTVLAFAGVSLLSEVIMCVSDYKGLVIQKDIFKAMNNMIFKKASEADISCYFFFRCCLFLRLSLSKAKRFISAIWK